MTKVLVDGDASGWLLVLTEPLSFWGGVDPGSGRIIDRSHHAVGESVTGKILSMPHGRGSSSSASVIAETIRNGVGPVGFILAEPDEIVVTGVFVANSLYGTSVPVVITDVPENPDKPIHLSAEGACEVEDE
jgi:predicted aconitase with swiveling domain